MLGAMKELQENENLNEAVKFSMLQKAGNKAPELNRMVMYRGSNSFKESKTPVANFENRRRMYPSLTTAP